ncbi:unnamed protein product [Schistosoma mattheei]|uniref:Uncharacterized protein n=1 Tax=Schistosoma mattheei TaxID=31246 RepID=A0A183P7W5_9TREM|nr:unnamed protein product [Schistosoma mattheei]
MRLGESHCKGGTRESSGMSLYALIKSMTKAYLSPNLGELQHSRLY